MPVPKPNIGTTFIPRVELVIEEAQLRLRWEASPFDGSVNGQAIVGCNDWPVLCNIHRNGTIQGPDLQWRTILEVTQMGVRTTNLHSTGFFNPARWKRDISLP